MKVKLEELNNDSRFTLTGSRYWNKKSPELVELTNTTDYDYVVEYSEELFKEFIAKGYYSRNPKWSNGISALAKVYTDATTVVVLYYKDIQLILKRDVEKYLTIHDLPTVFYVKYLWKRYLPTSAIQNMIKLLTYNYD